VKHGIESKKNYWRKGWLSMKQALLSTEQIDLIITKHPNIKDAITEAVKLQDIRTKQKLISVVDSCHTSNLKYGGFVVLGIVGDGEYRGSEHVYWDDFKKGLMWL